jgi:hypothetical protein
MTLTAGKLVLAKDYIPPGPLDVVGNAAVAYSLRDLSSTYLGPVVRVRRSSDGVEQDFTSDQVADGTLTTFCGAGDGFVRTWYDQSGNTNNASQTTTSLQPQIVASGGLIITDGTPGLRFAVDNTDNDIHLSLGSFTQSQPLSIFAAANRISALNRQVLYTNSNASFQIAGHVTADVRITAGTILNYQIAATTGKQLHTGIFNGTSSVAAFNGTATTGNTGTGAILTGSRISGFSPSTNIGYSWIGSVYELIIYPTDQTSNRTTIESNINSHYAIY